MKHAFVFSVLIVLCYAVPATAAERSYALWNGDSVNDANIVVQIRDRDFVDFAPLKPVSAVKVKQAIYNLDKDKILIQSDLFLVKMEGPLNGHFCTWRQGHRSYPAGAPPQTAQPVLCLAMSPEGKSTDLRYVSSYFAPMLRTSLPEMGSRPKNVNSVDMEVANTQAYPSDIRFGFVARISRIKGARTKGEATACLRSALASVNPEVKDKAYGYDDFCFGFIGETVDLGEGRYTLLDVDEKKKIISIRIDKPLKLRNFGPELAL